MASDPVDLRTLGPLLASLYEALNNRNAYTDDEKRKVGHLTVETAIDLDAIKARIDAMAGGFRYMGEWDASSGVFPGGGLAQNGQTWRVSASGVVDGVSFEVGDRIAALADDASTSAYQGQWLKEDFTDDVKSVATLTGDITVEQLLSALGVETGATQNRSDAELLDRSNHQGMQPIETIQGLATTLASFASLSHQHTVADVTNFAVQWRALFDATLLPGDGYDIIQNPDGSRQLLITGAVTPPPAQPVAQIDDQPSDPNEWARFVNRAYGGAAPTEYERDVAQISLTQEFVDQFDLQKNPIRKTEPSLRTASTLPDRDNWNVSILSSQWTRMIAIDMFAGGSPLINRAWYALSQFIIVSTVNSDVRPHHLLAWHDLMREKVPTTFQELLQAAALNAAMAYNLTFMGKTKADPVTGVRPDQNFARELMQLFAIGTVILNDDGTPMLNGLGLPIPAYTQLDIEQLSRVFTGFANPGMVAAAYAVKDPKTVSPEWAAQGTSSNFGTPIDFTLPLHCYTDDHEWGEKTFLGSTIDAVTDPALQTVEAARNEVRKAVEIVCSHSNFETFVAKRMIQFMIKESPSGDYVRYVGDAGRAGRFELPNGTVIGSGQRSDLKAMLAAMLFHEEARQIDLADPNAGRIQTPYLAMVQFQRYVSGKPDLYPASLNPPTLRDFIQDLDNREYLHFTEQDELTPSQAFYSQPSVFGKRPGFKDIGSPAGDAGLETPGLQGFNWSTMLELWDFQAWMSGGGSTYKYSWERGHEIAGGWAALNLAMSADPDGFVDTINQHVHGGLLTLQTVDLLKRIARIRVNEASSGDDTGLGTTSLGGPQGGAIGLIFISMLATEYWVQR